MKCTTSFSGLLEGFFSVRLLAQRRASPHTVASYRDCFRLLLKFARDRLGKAPSQLALADLDASFIGAFLHHLEHDRGNSARTRNARLAAIRSFFHYLAFEVPEHAALIQRVLAIPNKRCEHKPIDFLNRTEVAALLAAPDLNTWGGRRDRALLLLAVQTGLRVSELVGLNCEDLALGTGSSYVRCQGKGRKERVTPLRAQTATVMRDWLRERDGHPGDPLFPNARGGRLSRDGVEHLLAKHVTAAAQQCPGLQTKRISVHVLRHTAAMDLLQHGVDRSIIALWLGHESIATTEVYIHADMNLKERVLAKASPLEVPPGRYRPGDRLLGFLDRL
ncbi:MAG TPA: tyrosine-type recombinase/integrase [Thermoanaerobaculia bacterium]|nr:tyrosine-type recombinase/integrase [Thermoanaerobaculia bacterium]